MLFSIFLVTMMVPWYPLVMKTSRDQFWVRRAGGLNVFVLGGTVVTISGMMYLHQPDILVNQAFWLVLVVGFAGMHCSYRISGDRRRWQEFERQAKVLSQVRTSTPPLQ
jgi:4-amino-4-deoxy-L-arabinose transferase-like glycosyltransferase